MTILKGNLITMALNGEFDVIVHGCNCFNRMRRGIGVDMAREFKADIVDNEHHKSKDEDYEEWHKSELLGNIEWYNPNEDLLKVSPNIKPVFTNLKTNESAIAEDETLKVSITVEDE